jgi:hypothetical protein
MMDNMGSPMMGSMIIWNTVGILLIVLLIVVIVKLMKK